MLRGHQEGTISLFSYVSIEERIPAKHPLRRIRFLANEALKGLDRTFEQLYACSGRPSIPPEQLLRSLLLQAIYGLRSQRLLLEQLDDNMLYRWFVGLGADDPIWHQTSFSKNRERLLNQKVLSLFLEKLLGMEEVKPLLSNDHFSVDGTLLQAWASHNSLKPVDGQQDSGQNNSTPPSPPASPCQAGQGFGNTETASGGKQKQRASRDFHGERFSNSTHRSSTDADARLARRSKAHAALLSFLGHVLMDNRHHLVVDSRVTLANGYGERDAAQQMVDALTGEHPRTIGADKGYDTQGFVRFMRWRGVTPHVAQNTKRKGGSAIDQRTTRHPGYRQSLNARRGIEKVFGWIKQAAGLRQCKHRGRSTVGGVFLLHVIAYDMVRLANILKAKVAVA